MKKKILFTFLLVISAFFSSVFAEEKLSLGGSWSYQFSNDNRECQIRGGEVINRTAEKQTFKLVFVLSMIEQKTFGNQLNGVYVVGSKMYDTLESGYQYNDCYFTCNEFKYAQPYDGTYYPIIVLLRKSGPRWVLDDGLSFSKPLKFENLIMKKVSQLKRDLDEAKIKEASYQRLNNYYPDHPENWIALRDWQDRRYEIERQLIDLGYDSKGLVSMQSGKVAAYSNIQSVPDYVPSASSSSYSSSSSYEPSYTPSTSSSSSSSSSGSGMHKEWVKCTACNGTGKNSLPKYAPIYGDKSKASRPWCDICKKYDYGHSHDYCHLCNGRGEWEKWVKD